MTQLTQTLEQTNTMIQQCQYGANMLLQLTNQIMDLANDEKDTFKLSIGYFDLRSTLKQSMLVLQFLQKTKNVSVAVNIEQRMLPILSHVVGDGSRLEQALINLLSNSMKFTPDGGRVELGMRIDSINKVNIVDGKPLLQLDFTWDNANEYNLSQFAHRKVIGDDKNDEFVFQNEDILGTIENEDSQHLFVVNYQVIIKDSGLGISKKGLQTLFNEKNSLEEHKSVNSRGTGYGLFIVRKTLVDKMRGKIIVTTKKGKGTQM